MACRDHSNRQHIVHFFLQDGRILDESVILSPGAPGLFDADGVGYPLLRRVPEGWELWYVGWRRLGGAVAFQNQIGMARLDADLKIVERHAAPWLALTDSEPIGSGSLCVVDAPGLEPRLLYTSFLEWIARDDGVRHRYTVNDLPMSAARSADRVGSVAIPLNAGEYALGHPSVISWGPGFLCMFTARGHSYRLYAALSEDGKQWRRTSGPVVIPPVDGCRAAQCYPRLIRDGTDLVLFFSGDNYGTESLFRTRRPLPSAFTSSW